MQHYDYNIADITLRSYTDLVEVGLRGFKPFAVPSDRQTMDADCTLRFITELSESQRTPLRELSTSYVVEADADGAFARTESGYLYSIKSRGSDADATLFHIDSASRARARAHTRAYGERISRARSSLTTTHQYCASSATRCVYMARHGAARHPATRASATLLRASVASVRRHTTRYADSAP